MHIRKTNKVQKGRKINVQKRKEKTIEYSKNILCTKLVTNVVNPRTSERLSENVYWLVTRVDETSSHAL